jgi:hypothetical protein
VKASAGAAGSNLVGHYREVGRRSILSSPAAIRDCESVAPPLWIAAVAT